MSFMCHVAEAVSCFRSSQSQSLCALVHICGDPSFIVWRLESPLSFRNGCVVQTQFDMTLCRVSHLSFRFIRVDQVIVWKSYDFALDELPWKAHDTRACNVQSLHEFSSNMFSSATLQEVLFGVVVTEEVLLYFTITMWSHGGVSHCWKSQGFCCLDRCWESNLLGWCRVGRWLFPDFSKYFCKAMLFI